jgi:DNA-directed RNA polymerase alpha subunit
MEKDYSHLHEKPIEKLGLSVVSLNALKRSGVTSIGDCIDVYLRALGGVVGSCPSSFLEAMFGEVKEKIQELGYWSYVENEE